MVPSMKFELKGKRKESVFINPIEPVHELWLVLD